MISAAQLDYPLKSFGWLFASLFSPNVTRIIFIEENSKLELPIVELSLNPLDFHETSPSIANLVMQY